MNVVIAGADADGLGNALEARGVTLARVNIANRPALEEAGIHDADVYVLTDAEQATSIVVARDLNPDLRVVAYTGNSLPEFVSGQQVLSMDPDLLGPATVAEELTDES